MTKWKEQQQMQNNEQNRQIMLKLEINKWINDSCLTPQLI